MRETAVCDIPVVLAMDRVDQWVASAGRSSSVLVITASTFSSVIRRGRPGRGSSSRPGRRIAANRLRHFVTVTRFTPISSATAPLVRPSAQATTMRDRNASDCAVFGRRAQARNVTDSSSDSRSTTALGTGIRIF
jgi:hypothetical protein